MAACIRVTIRSVITAGVRPKRAPRAPEDPFRQVSWLAVLTLPGLPRLCSAKSSCILEKCLPPIVAGQARIWHAIEMANARDSILADQRT